MGVTSEPRLTSTFRLYLCRHFVPVEDIIKINQQKLGRFLNTGRATKTLRYPTNHRSQNVSKV